MKLSSVVIHIERNLSACLFALIVSGCGVTIQANRPAYTASGQLPSAIAGEGAIYTLPRTDFLILQPLTLVEIRGGIFSPIWEACLRDIEARINAPRSGGEDPCNFDTRTTLSYGRATFQAVTNSDPKRLYRVSIDADMFTTNNFQMSVAKTGSIQSLSAAATNTTYEVVSAVVTDIIKIAGATTMAFVPDDVRAAPPRKDIIKDTQPFPCVRAERIAQDSAKAKTGTLTVASVATIQACLKRYKHDLDVAIAERKALHKGAYKDKTVAYLDRRDAFLKEQIDAARKALDDIKSVVGLQDSTVTKTTTIMTIPATGPSEFTDLNACVDLKATVSSSKVSFPDSLEKPQAFVQLLKETLATENRIYRLSASSPTDVAVSSVTEPTDAKGFRYRVPISTDVSLNSKIGSDPEVIIATIAMPIAQYGPIAALTSRFHGKGGKVAFTIWEDTGGLKTVEIGSDAMPTTAVTDPLLKVTDTLIDRKKAQIQAAKDAAAYDPELEALKKEEAKLDLREKIVNHQKAISGGQ